MQIHKPELADANAAWIVDFDLGEPERVSLNQLSSGMHDRLSKAEARAEPARREDLPAQTRRIEDVVREPLAHEARGKDERLAAAEKVHARRPLKLKRLVIPRIERQIELTRIDQWMGAPAFERRSERRRRLEPVLRVNLDLLHDAADSRAVAGLGLTTAEAGRPTRTLSERLRDVNTQRVELADHANAHHAHLLRNLIDEPGQLGGRHAESVRAGGLRAGREVEPEVAPPGRARRHRSPGRPPIHHSHQFARRAPREREIVHHGVDLGIRQAELVDIRARDRPLHRRPEPSHHSLGVVESSCVGGPASKPRFVKNRSAPSRSASRLSESSFIHSSVRSAFAKTLKPGSPR